MDAHTHHGDSIAQPMGTFVDSEDQVETEALNQPSLQLNEWGSHL